MKHFNIKLYGQVQMVLFRHSAKEKAKELEVFGFVRNESDGTVYIEVEGEEYVLNKFLEWCKKGPVSARVQRVDLEEGMLQNFKEFKIEY